MPGEGGLEGGGGGGRVRAACLPLSSPAVKARRPGLAGSLPLSFPPTARAAAALVTFSSQIHYDVQHFNPMCPMEPHPNHNHLITILRLAAAP